MDYNGRTHISKAWNLWRFDEPVTYYEDTNNLTKL